MILRHALSAAVALGLGSEAAAEQFNLVCRGTLNLPTNAQFDRTFRVDLDRRLFCQADCRTVQPIQVTGPPTLLFKDFDRLTGSVHQVDVADGGYRSYNSNTSAKGRCRRQPFSGFPAKYRR